MDMEQYKVLAKEINEIRNGLLVDVSKVEELNKVLKSKVLVNDVKKLQGLITSLDKKRSELEDRVFKEHPEDAMMFIILLLMSKG